MKRDAQAARPVCEERGAEAKAATLAGHLPQVSPLHTCRPAQAAPSLALCTDGLLLLCQKVSSIPLVRQCWSFEEIMFQTDIPMNLPKQAIPSWLLLPISCCCFSGHFQISLSSCGSSLIPVSTANVMSP